MLKLLSRTLLLFLLFAAPAFSGGYGIDSSDSEKIRKLFYAGIEDEDRVEELLALLSGQFRKSLQSKNPFVLAYYGAGETLLGKHAWNPISKLSHLNTGLEKIAGALAKAPDDLEFRFLRFSILHHLPGILGYSEERDQDKSMIYALLIKGDQQGMDRKTYRGIVEFMISSERMSETENQRLNSLLSRL